MYYMNGNLQCYSYKHEFKRRVKRIRWLGQNPASPSFNGCFLFSFSRLRCIDTQNIPYEGVEGDQTAKITVWKHE